jgi:hypothetical protein
MTDVNHMAVEASRDAAARAEEQNRRNLLISVLDTLPRGPSDRDALAEKAMVAYLLSYASKDYGTVAGYAYEMADAMIAERLKRSTEKS